MFQETKLEESPLNISDEHPKAKDDDLLEIQHTPITSFTTYK